MLTKATTRVDGSPGISVRTLVAEERSKDDYVEWRRGRSSGDQQHTFDAEDGRLSTRRSPPTTAEGDMAEKLAENPRDSKSIEEGSVAQRSAVFLAISMSLFTSIFVRLDRDDRGRTDHRATLRSIYRARRQKEKKKERERVWRSDEAQCCDNNSYDDFLR